MQVAARAAARRTCSRHSLLLNHKPDSSLTGSALTALPVAIRLMTEIAAVLTDLAGEGRCGWDEYNVSTNNSSTC